MEIEIRMPKLLVLVVFLSLFVPGFSDLHVPEVRNTRKIRKLNKTYLEVEV